MKAKAFALVSVAGGAITLAGSAEAALLGTMIVDMGDLGTGLGTRSYRVYVQFDDVSDQLLAISGNADIAPLVFWADTPLIQNAGAIDALREGDVPSALDAGGDSWVTIGGDGTFLSHQTSFAPDFLGDPSGALSVINGSFFSQPDNGGYFDENPGSAKDGGMVLIAQFTLAEGFSFSFSGTVDYNEGGTTLTSHFFSAVLPAPSTLAVLGLTGFATSRRRRR